jgi:hypothetical protein
LDSKSTAHDDFLHVSLLYLSPVIPTFRLLHWPCKDIDSLGFLHLEATDKYFTLFEYLAFVMDEDDGTIHVQQFRLRMSSAPLDAIRPRCVQVKSHGPPVSCSDALRKSCAKKSKIGTDFDQLDDSALEDLEVDLFERTKCGSKWACRWQSPGR